MTTPFHAAFPAAPKSEPEPLRSPSRPMGFRVGRVAGIELRMGASVAIIALLVEGIWLVLIGWFLNAAALRSYAHTVQRMRQIP